MPSKFKSEIPIALSERGVEVRADAMGDLLVAFERWPKGDWSPVFHGLPDDMCQAEHWGYMLKGRGRLVTKDGVTDILPGQAYHSPPGHTFEVTEDAEFLEFTKPNATYETDVNLMIENFRAMPAAPPKPRA